MWPFEHKCNGLPIQVQHRKQQTGGSLFSGPTGPEEPVTIVLLRCKCGSLTTRTLIGDWTLDEVNGRADSKLTVDAFLKAGQP